MYSDCLKNLIREKEVMFKSMKKPLFILEMANNHMGNVNHGVRMISEFKTVIEKFEEIFQFAFKLQLRDPSIIHPDYVNRMDLKNIKRFSETRLSSSDFKLLHKEIKNAGFISMCTPFDELSVQVMLDMDFDVFKIASCSFADWSLMEALDNVNKPIIISSACAELGTIDKVVSFLKNRNKDFCLMHCVSAYPTKDSDLEINQIDFLKQRYNGVLVGFSTHESPDCTDSIKIAIAKGSMIFEKHVGVPTEKYAINAYSATPEQVNKWLKSAESAYQMCGGVSDRRMTFTKESKEGILPFVRGCFVRNDVKKGKKIEKENIFLAIPNVPDQLLATDISKYAEFEAKCDIKANEPILHNNVVVRNSREKLESIMCKVYKILQDANIVIPNGTSCSISAHYGIDNFHEYGVIAFDIVNREYCKKILVMLPEQNHPIHYHKIKEETFQVLSGDMKLQIENELYTLKSGELITVNREQKHSFGTSNGVVIEEISTTHINDDSYYDDTTITDNKDRKMSMIFFQSFFDEKNHLK
jgi:sialic acid synthase SpsE/quercetin dioxygenase-like cupin family protein